MPLPDEVDVTGWPVVAEEPMGEPGKPWLEEPATHLRWLFKPTRIQNDRRHGPFVQGDDWAERIAAAAAALIGLPAARVELARRDATVGALSLNVAGDRKLTLGNDVMWAHDPHYPTGRVGTIPEYNLDRIFDVLVKADVHPAPCDAPAPQTARSIFTGFLLLDAWIANQDRHHGNWGVLEDLVGGAPPTLAPSFDHGSSLGFGLHDDTKLQLLADGRIERWAARGSCRPMAGQPNLVRLAWEAQERAGSPAGHWWARLGAVTARDEATIAATVAGARMSHPSRIFVAAVLETNRRRLLDGF